MQLAVGQRYPSECHYCHLLALWKTPAGGLTVAG